MPRENALTPQPLERRQHRGRLLPIALIQRSRQGILEVSPEDDHVGKLNNMYLGRKDEPMHDSEDKMLPTDLEAEHSQQPPIDGKSNDL